MQKSRHTGSGADGDDDDDDGDDDKDDDLGDDDVCGELLPVRATPVNP
jgi:hypothetical protein